MSSGIRRWFASLSIAALCAAFVFVGGAGSALARADCLQSDPKADVFITITSLSTLLSSSALHAVVTNDGPCNVPDAVVTFTFPADTTNISVTTNPSSWNCGISTSGTVVTCPQSGGAPTIGVPGNHDFAITFTYSPGPASDQTITAQVTVGGGPAACIDGSASTTCDFFQDNNTIWGLTYAGAAASLTTCPGHPNRPGGGNGGNNVCGSQQFTDVSVDAAGTTGNVLVQQLASSCPASFPNCFGKLVSVKSLITGTLTTKTFTIDGSLAHGSYGGVNLVHCSDTTTESSCVSSSGGWSLVADCSRTNPTYPCVVTKTKFKVGGITYYQFVVLTDGDDGWGFDG